MSSRGNLEALSKVLGKEATYVNVFLANHIQAVRDPQNICQSQKQIISKAETKVLPSWFLF